MHTAAFVYKQKITNDLKIFNFNKKTEDNPYSRVIIKKPGAP